MPRPAWHEKRRAVAVRSRRERALAALALVPLLAPGASGEERPFDFQVGGGVTLPAGSITTRFETGWHLTGGAGWGLGEHVGLRLDYTHTRERLVGTALPDAFVEGRHGVQSLELDARWRIDPGASTRLDLLAGPGLHLRRTEITSVSRDTPDPLECDPWLQVCVEGPVPPEEIIGSRSSTDLGFNLGMAVEVPLWRSVRFLIDVRWRYVWGDTYGLPGEASRRSSSSYFPLSFGLRF